MANPNMADKIYIADPRAVSRFLASRDFARSRKARGRLADYATTGFEVKRFLGEVQVSWVTDCREAGLTGVTEAAILQTMAKVLGERYEVGMREGFLTVSEKVLKPEVLSFYKSQGVFGLEYVAETDKHRYVVRRHPDDSRKWELRVYTLKSVGFIEPIMIADEIVWAICSDTKTEAVDDAHQHLKKVS